MAVAQYPVNIFECSLCPQLSFPTPEELCQHMKNYHEMLDMEIQSIFFSERTTFQYWLKTVEDGRGQPGGYVQTQPNPLLPSGTLNDEYYLLCKKKYSTLKRRRISGDQKRGGSQHVVCAAFVHVSENSNGSVWVRFCLEHCGHPILPKRLVNKEGNVTGKAGSGHLKRNTSSAIADSGDEDYESEVVEEGSHASVDYLTTQPGPSNRGRLLEDAALISTQRRAVLSTLESELAFAKASVSSIKDLVNVEPTANVCSQLQIMANQLRTVTQVLSDLAVDVSSSSATYRPMEM